MLKRDSLILVIAIVCGVVASFFVLSILRKAPSPGGLSAAAKAPSGPLPIPEGMRAVTLLNKDAETVPDLVSSGSFVDILGIAPNYAGQMEMQTIVRGAQVLSVDKAERLTVAVTPAGAEVLSKAMTQGKLNIILRPDKGEKSAFKFGSVGFTEIIRGVEKDKNVHMEK